MLLWQTGPQISLSRSLVGTSAMCGWSMESKACPLERRSSSTRFLKSISPSATPNHEILLDQATSGHPNNQGLSRVPDRQGGCLRPVLPNRRPGSPTPAPTDDRENFHVGKPAPASQRHAYEPLY